MLLQLHSKEIGRRNHKSSGLTYISHQLPFIVIMNSRPHILNFSPEYWSQNSLGTNINLPLLTLLLFG